MEPLWEILPWLIAMLLLIACSAFFSGSEAALFYLRWEDRRLLESGNAWQKAAARLLDRPERLLSAVLFWNLVVNIIYFAITAIVGLHLERREAGTPLAMAFAAASLLTIILFSEMLPKSVAVLRARMVAGMVGIPLSVAVRVVDPLIPALRMINLLSRRLIWPNFQPEPYMQITDLQRVIELSTSDANLIEQEQIVLGNLVLLSEIRVDQWMRPRSQFHAFPPDVTLADLRGRHPAGGYVLLAESDSEEVTAAVPLRQLAATSGQPLARVAQPVLLLPWCAMLADAFDRMQRAKRRVAAVMNEYGETIGVLTLEDILDAIFSQETQTDQSTDHKALRELTSGVWQIYGRVSLRRLARYFQVELPSTRAVTVAGVLHEVLQRLPEPGDDCQWGPFTLNVLRTIGRSELVVELRLRAPEEPTP